MRNLAGKYAEPELVSACSKGESWAWDALVDRYRRLVYSISLRAGLTQQDAADVFQTVFTRLFENLHTIRDPQGLGAWLITTTKRESWQVLRGRRREAPTEDLSVGPSLAEERSVNTRPNEDDWMDQALVRDALERVGGRCEKLLLLLYWDPTEPSYKQVSRQVKIPLGSIGPTRARCLQKVRRVLESMGMGEM